jgi:hypothetical protein
VNHTGKDPLQRRLEIVNWMILGVFIFVSEFLFSPEFTLGILLGGLISIVNYHWLYRDVKNVFQHMNDRAKSRIMLKYYIRFGVTAIALFFIVSSQIVDVIGLLIGLSTIIINIILTAIVALAKKTCIEEVN